MPRTEPKMTRKASSRSKPDLSRLGIRLATASEWSAEGWAAGDGFASTTDDQNKSCRQQSLSNKTSGQWRTTATTRGHDSSGSSGAKSSPHKHHKSGAKPMSRFVTQLSQLIENTSVNGSETSESVINDGTPVLLDTSSPIKAPQISFDDHSSPLKNQSDRQSVQKESIGQLMQKSIVSDFDDWSRRLNKQSDNGVKACLRTKTLKVLKAMKQSRLEFSQRNSLINRAITKALKLRLTKAESVCGISHLYCKVLSDETNHFEANTSLVVLLNYKIEEALDLNTGYTLNVYPRWTRLDTERQIYILNAFNVEFVESVDPMDDQISDDCDYSVYWQNNRP